MHAPAAALRPVSVLGVRLSLPCSPPPPSPSPPPSPVTPLPSDKTGTLTTNEMSVVRFVNFAANGHDLVGHTVEGTTYEPVGEIVGRAGIDPAEAGLADFAKVRWRRGSLSGVGLR